jgi:CRP-like cAMP-binding protein
MAGDEMFVVVSGLVKLAGSSRDGDEVVYRSAGPGDTFGELSALDGGTRSASAVALKPTRLLMIPGEALRRALRTDAELAASVLQVVAGALRATTRQHADLLFVDLAGRVASYLVEQAGNTQRVELELSQGDLGSLLGASRQSVNQVLRSFEQEGLIRRRGRVLDVVRPADLRDRAGL